MEQRSTASSIQRQAERLLETCEICGREHKPTNNRQKHCKECAGKRISMQAAERYERHKEQPDFARRRKAAQMKYEEKVRKCKNSARKR